MTSTKHLSILAGFTISMLLLAGLAPAQDSKSETSPLDPSRYVTLTWNKKPIASPTMDPWQVIGRRGTLGISFDLEEMKGAWDIETAGSLTIRGHVRNRTGGERNIEVPGYSMVGEKETTFDLDMNSARGLVDQLFQGSSFAHRIEIYEEQATQHHMLAQIQVYDHRIRQYLQYLEESEAALRAVYGQSLNFTLTEQHIRDAAALIRNAEERLGDFEAELAATHVAGTDRFFQLLARDIPAIRGYLDELDSLENRPYVEILGGMIGRGGKVIRATVTDLKQIIDELDNAALTDDGRQSIRERLVHLAGILIGLERGKFYFYTTAGAEYTRRLTEAPQYQRYMPTGAGGMGPVKPSELKYVLDEWDALPDSEKADRAAAQMGACRPRLPKMQPNVSDTAVTRFVEERVSVIKVLIESITGNRNYGAVNERLGIENKFAGQLAPRLEHPRQLAAARDELNAEFLGRCTIAGAQLAYFEQADVARRIGLNNEALRVLLMIDAIHVLIDRIVPTYVSLDEISLNQLDQLAISVSFIPRSPDVLNDPDTPPPQVVPPPQRIYTFDAVSWGFSGPLPTVRDTLYFVEPRNGENYAVAPAVAAVWNYYGHGTQTKTFWRSFAPGFGFTTTFLNFDQDDTTIEFGLGPAFTFFNNILHVSVGWNLSAKATNESGSSRGYFAIGVSLTEVTKRLAGDE